MNNHSTSVVYARSSGFVVTAGPSMDVQLVLVLPKGEWGPAVAAPGSGRVATVVAQHRAGGNLTVDLRTHTDGRVPLSVTSIGHPASTWRGTIVVRPT